MHQELKQVIPEIEENYKYLYIWYVIAKFCSIAGVWAKQSK